MQIKTKAIAFNADSFHSNKTNQDYHRVGLLIEGVATNFFVGDKAWGEFMKQPCFNAICASHEPTPVDMDLELKFDDKGCKTYLNAISAVKGK